MIRCEKRGEREEHISVCTHCLRSSQTLICGMFRKVERRTENPKR
jgi:hypothetical protein